MSVWLQISRKRNSEFWFLHHAGDLNLAQLGQMIHPKWVLIIIVAVN